MLARYGIVLSLLTLISTASAIVLDVNDRQSIVNATALLAHGVQELYDGNRT